MKQSTLASGLRQVAAGKVRTPAPEETAPTAAPARRGKRKPGAKTLIGGMFDPEVRRTLTLIGAEPENDGRSLQDLLGEAINDLAAKYGKPQPYQLDQ